MTRAPLKVLLATTNRGKLAELRSLFSDLPIELLALGDVLPNYPAVVEDGATFLDNALIKARAAVRAANLVTIAEDSGLEVDALGGRPGVRSARFAGDDATDAENNAALLAELAHVEEGRRQARFRCVMVLVGPGSEDRPVVTEGRCEGAIARQEKGTGGFGYDPLFVVEADGRTMAELPEGDKNRASHRGKAALAMRPALAALAAQRRDGSEPPSAAG